MDHKIYIVAAGLKDFLALFDQNAVLNNIILGDTWHPSSGFVDETILEGKNKISELLAFDYNFIGLVEFKACLGSMKMEWISTHENHQGTEPMAELMRQPYIVGSRLPAVKRINL